MIPDRDSFPLTFKALSQIEDANLLFDHITNLESDWLNRLENKPISRLDTQVDEQYDLVVAGGGLSLVYAIQFAKKGYRVMVLDRLKVGSSHREWNVSQGELNAFVEAGVFCLDELNSIVNLRYEYGIVRFHGGSEHRVRGVLDLAIDAQKLLDKLRAKALDAKVTVLDYYNCQAIHKAERGLVLKLLAQREGQDDLIIGTRLLLDGRGALSGYGQFDIVCPTVGGVIAGLDHGSGIRQVNPRVGEILISSEGVEEGRQHIWEGFPISGEKLTTYLFYYSDPQLLGANPLFSLYERFFRKLPVYKRGDILVEKATYGFIPGNTRLRSCSLSPFDRVYLVGDAAARHSPLTFCGFGATLRSFRVLSEKLAVLLDDDRLDATTLNKVRCEKEGLRVMGGLALMMMAERLPGQYDPNQINSLLDDAFSVLSSRGEEMYRQFMLDEIRFSEFVSYMLEVAKRRPEVWSEVGNRLSLQELKDYSIQLARFACSDLCV